MAEWFEDDSLWIELEPFLFSEERMQRGDEEVEQLLELTRFQGKTVLDLCCGPGRHTTALARRGIRVTGVDRTRHHIERARARAEAEGLHVELVQADMREFARPEAFDMATSMYTSFGYFRTPEEDLVVLRNLHASLVPWGIAVLELMSKERLAKVFQPTISRQGPDDSLLVERHEVLDGWSRIRNTWILIVKGRARTFEFEHNLYSGTELRAMLREAGFAQVKLFGGLDGRKYDTEASRLVAVAWKAT